MSTGRELLIETISPKSNPVQLVNEAEGSTGKITLKGLAIQGDVKNHNGRIYPSGEIRKAVNEINAKIEQDGPILGECDHPDGLNINLDRVSHIIKKMWLDESGTNGMAEFEVIHDVGLGQIIAGIIKHGVKLGVSSRGTGSVGSDGRVSDFDMVTIDIVANPSAPNAFPKPILESALMDRNGREALKLTEAVRHDPKAQKYFQKSLLSFVGSLGE
jgi:hypothetical protein